MGNRSKRGHWHVKRCTTGGIAIKQKRWCPGHGCVARTQNKNPLPGAGADKTDYRKTFFD